MPAVSMPALIPKPMVNILDASHLLPLFLQVGSKITLKKDGQYHKGYLSHLPDGTYWFSYKSQVNKSTNMTGVFPSLISSQHGKISAQMASSSLVIHGHPSTAPFWPAHQVST
jgi:hypothetical protein